MLIESGSEDDAVSVSPFLDMLMVPCEMVKRCDSDKPRVRVLSDSDAVDVTFVVGERL